MSARRNESRGKSKHQNPAAMRQDGTQAAPRTKSESGPLAVAGAPKIGHNGRRLSGGHTSAHHNRVISESPASNSIQTSKELHVLIASHPCSGPRSDPRGGRSSGGRAEGG